MHLYEDLGGKLELFLKGMRRPLQIILLARMYICMPYMAVSSPNAYCSSEHLCERPNITYNALKFNVGLKTYLMGIFWCILKSLKILTIFTPCNSKDSKV